MKHVAIVLFGIALAGCATTSGFPYADSYVDDDTAAPAVQYQSDQRVTMKDVGRYFNSFMTEVALIGDEMVRVGFTVATWP